MKPKHTFSWYFGDCCRYYNHGFPNAQDGASCVCGLTLIRQRKGGWDAVWNTAGVRVKPKRVRVVAMIGGVVTS